MGTVTDTDASDGRDSPLVALARIGLERCEARCDLRKVLEPGRAFCQVTLKPTHRRSLELRRSALGVEMDELEGVLERQVRQLARRVLGGPQSSALDRSAEADVSVGLGSHERMFP